MLDESTRSAILALGQKGHGVRKIARTLKVSRPSVRKVLQSNSAQVSPLHRAQAADPFVDQLQALIARYEGHIGRVHEELVQQGATFSYSALTAFCRRHGLGKPAKLPAGRYEFAPGQEMQHDTSPHHALINSVRTKVQTASLVLCYSRMIFFQHYPRFTRFECKCFLTAAFDYFQGLCQRCMIDNTHVVVLQGTGANMVVTAEMEAFARRYGFCFVAHEKGDANRSARVEAPFHRIDRAFLRGECFADWTDLNARARARCDQWNAAWSNKLHASRRELFARERAHLQRLPAHIPEVYRLHTRTVDAEGYIHLGRIRYSVPHTLLDKTLEVREMQERVEVYQGPRKVASHKRVLGPLDTRVTDPDHRPPRGQGRKRSEPPPEIATIAAMEPCLQGYVTALHKHCGSRRNPLRRLLAMLREYPREPFATAVRQAEHYGLFDVERLETMVLKQIASDYFILPPTQDDPENEHER